MKTKVAIISVYLGPLPKHFNFFKHTAHFNKDYNWFIFTDQIIQSYKEDNVYFFPYSLKRLNRDLSALFKLDISIREYNQIGDIKPLYAKLFKKYIDHVDTYDWWGWTDLDVLNGNFNNFLNDDIFNEYDIIGVTNSTLLPGRTMFNGPHLLISMKHKNLYKKIKNYGEMLMKGNPKRKHNAYNIEERHFYDVVVNKKLKIFQGKYIDGYLIALIRHGKRKLPASWNNGDMQLQSYKDDFPANYALKYGCDTMVYHMPKGTYNIIQVSDNLITLN